MARTKKQKEEKEFIPSKYQQDIFEYIQKGNGNLVVEAAAGCGKTSTLIQAIKYVPLDKNILFCAFNKDIVTELEKKIDKQDNITISTIHSLGLKILNINYKGIIDKVPNPSKYRSHITNYLQDYTTIDTRKLTRIEYFAYINNISALVELLRLNLIDNDKDAMNIVEHHGIDLIADEVYVALDIMEWGKKHLDDIDYTDMVWLPNVLYCKPWGNQFDFIFVDECQDLNIAQRELIFKCKKMGTRYIFVGDKNQAIYAFSGASPEAFDFLKKLENTVSLPLSISYRCPKNVVKFAQTYVPTIQYKDDALDGEIAYNAKFDDVQDGDMILCRNNAPLMKMYSELLKLDKKCYIRGKDIGKNLITVIKSTNKEELNASLNKDGVFAQLYNRLFELRDKISKQFQIDKKDALNTTVCTEWLDKIKALEFLSENINTSAELIDKIKTIFADKKKGGISLSTIHKAKGLEANNVFIACRSLMPSKSAEKDWEKVQEKNLIYVAYTRAKNKLAFLNEDDFKNANVEEAKISLENIERVVNILLHKDSSLASEYNITNLNRILKKEIPIRKNNNRDINTISRQPLRLGRTKISQIKKSIYR